jgi:hypothetical protein
MNQQQYQDQTKEKEIAFWNKREQQRQQQQLLEEKKKRNRCI